MRICTGIASSTHVDRHLERMAKSALDQMKDRINKLYLPLTGDDHDAGNPKGVLLYAEVFQLEDGEYALGIVTGVFEEPADRYLYPFKQDNTVSDEFRDCLNIDHLKAIMRQGNKGSTIFNGISIEALASLMEMFLDSSEINDQGRLLRLKKFIASTGDLRIEIYPRDHLPDHFHVVSKPRGINARFEIETLEYIGNKYGHMRRKDIKKIKEFLHANPSYVKLLREECARMKQAR